MRTKTLLATAAALAAGLFAASAQSNVYSLNVVGYINLQLQPGLNLITSQLKGTNQGVNTILASANPVIAANSLLFQWNPAGQTFANAQIAGGDGVWYDPNTGNPSTSTVNPGEAFFVQNMGAVSTLTLVGEVPQGTNSINVVSGLGFYGDPTPVSQDIVTNGFPMADNALLYIFPAGGKTYQNAYIGAGPGSGGPAWFDPNTGNPFVFAPVVGQGFVVSYPGTATKWNRVFNVQ